MGLTVEIRDRMFSLIVEHGNGGRWASVSIVCSERPSGPDSHGPSTECRRSGGWTSDKGGCLTAERAAVVRARERGGRRLSLLDATPRRVWAWSRGGRVAVTPAQAAAAPQDKGPKPVTPVFRSPPAPRPHEEPGRLGAWTDRSAPASQPVAHLEFLASKRLVSPPLQRAIRLRRASHHAVVM